MTTDLATLREKINPLMADYQHQGRLILQEEATLSQCRERVSQVEQAQGITQEVAEKVQQQAHQQIASVVTKALESVFEDSYEFKIVFERKRGRTEARLVFLD